MEILNVGQDEDEFELLVHSCDTYPEAEAWIDEQFRPDMLSSPTYNIRKVYQKKES